MMEENNDIFLDGGDGLVYLAVPMHTNILQHLFGAIYLVRTYLETDFSTPPLPHPHPPRLSLVSICTHLE